MNIKRAFMTFASFILIAGLHAQENKNIAKAEPPLEEEDVSDIEHLLLFIIYGIIVGMLLLGVKHLTNIPYTPMLLIIGIVIGLISKWIWAFGDAMDLVI